MKRTFYFLAALLVVALPALIASAVLWHFNQATLFDTLAVQADEIMYWHQAATVAEAGFNGGYYTAGEMLPRAGSFYSWGAAAPLYYGTIGAIFGWPAWSMAAVNLAFLALATAVFIRLNRLDYEGLFWLGGLLATFHPILTYSATQYIEVASIAVGLLLGGLFAPLIHAYRSNQPAGRALPLLTGAVIFLAAMTRFPWALLFVPLLILTLRPATPRAWATHLAAAVPLMLIPSVLYALTSAPYPTYTLGDILEKPTLDRAWRILSGNFERNFALFFDGDSIEIHVRAGAALAVIILTLIIAAAAIRHLRGSTLPPSLAPLFPEIAVAWYFLGAMMLFVIVVYDIHGLRGYRMLAGPLLMMIALAVAFRRRWLIAPLLAFQILAFPAALVFYDNFTNFQTSPEKHARYAEYQPQLADVLVFDPDAPSRWCNTVLFDLFYLLGETSVMVATPPGFGLSLTDAISFQTMPDAPQSQYIALENRTYIKYGKALNIEPLLRLPNGMLYRNLDSGCQRVQ